jgi:hypothetical protein
MKKFLAVFAVLVAVCLSSIALAADVTVGGAVSIRSRDFNDMKYNKNDHSADQVDTQERIILDVNAKADGVKGKISIWNDFDTWGRLETLQGTAIGSGPTGTTVASPTTIGIREAWINFNVPGLPLNVNVGHQFLQLGNGWFLRNKHFGSDAWVVANVTGNNTAAVVNIKVAEGKSAFGGDDADAYAFLDVFKLSDTAMVGFDFADVRVRPGLELQNVSLNFNGKLGPLNLMAQGDKQFGKVTGGATEPKFDGWEAVVQGNVALDPVAINFLVGQGSGKKSTDTDNKQYVNFLDIDPHYTFLYEYKLVTAAGAKNTGLSNTRVLSAGVAFDASKSLKLGIDFFNLAAAVKIKNGQGEESDDVGNEIDAKIYWKLYDNLAWNWDFGYFMPGKAFKTAAGTTDAAMGATGILTFKF